MFGFLKKKINDIVGKFSKDEEEKIEQLSEAELKKAEKSADEKPDISKPSLNPTEGEKIADLLVEAEKEIEEMEKAEQHEEVDKILEEKPEEKKAKKGLSEKKHAKKLKKALKIVEEIPVEPIQPELVQEDTQLDAQKIIHEEKKVGFLEKLFGKKESKTEEVKTGLIGIITEKEISKADVEKISEELKIALMESDVALEVADKICGSLAKDIAGKIVKRGDTEKMIKGSLRNSMAEILEQPGVEIEDVIERAKSEGRPATIIFLGFNGTGKTTTLAKVAHYLIEHGHIPVFAAGDTFRAASIEQLEVHAHRLGAGIIKHKYGSDSAAVIFDAREHAKAEGCDVVLADTAGRSHSNMNLMDELKKVIKVNNPDFKILVLDSLTGNDIVEQSQKFNEAVGVDGIILTKADVYEKGGAALSAVHTIKKPIIFLGTGQDYEDLKKFDAKEIVDNILG